MEIAGFGDDALGPGMAARMPARMGTLADALPSVLAARMRDVIGIGERYA